MQYIAYLIALKHWGTLLFEYNDVEFSWLTSIDHWKIHIMQYEVLTSAISKIDFGISEVWWPLFVSDSSLELKINCFKANISVDFICKCNSYLLIVVRAVFILYEAIRCLRHQGSTYDDVGTFIWHCLIKSYWPFSSCRSFSGEHSTIRLRCSSSSGSPHWFPWDCFVSKVVDYCNLYLTCEVD